MAPARLFLLAVIIYLGLAGRSAHAATVVIDGLAPQIAVGTSLEVLEDIDGTLTLDEVRQHDRWKPSDASEPNKGFTKSWWWFRFSLKRQTTEASLWYLVIDDAILNQIDVFLTSPNGGIQRYAGGGWVPVSQRAIPYRSHVFPLPATMEAPIDVYLRVKTDLALVLPIKLMSAREFIQHNTVQTWVYSLYIGFLTAMLLFNLMVYWRTRETANLFYCLFAASMLMLAITFSGLGKQFLWPTSLRADNLIYTVFVALSVMTGALFTETFLQSERNKSGSWTRVRQWTVIGTGSLAIFVTLNSSVQTGIQLATVCVLLGVPNILFNSLQELFRGNRNAPLLTVAWAGLLAGVFIFSLRGFGILPSNAFTTNAFLFASLFECMMLVIALVEKSRAMQRDIDEVSARTLAALETEVTARTAELRAMESAVLQQEKQQSLNMVTSAVTQAFMPAMAAVWQGALSAREQGHHIHHWLDELTGEDEELTGEIHGVFDKISRAESLIDQGMQRVDSIIQQLIHDDAKDTVQGICSWSSVTARILQLTPRLGVPVQTNFRIRPDTLIPGHVDLYDVVFSELLFNARDALQAIPIPPAIQLAGTESADHVTLVITDHGCGISPENLDKVFDPFFTTKPVGSGTGLGLTKVRERLQRIGGSIRINHGPDGTLCTLVIPKTFATEIPATEAIS